MRVTSKGQVTIPKELRERTGIMPGSEVEFGTAGDALTLRRSPARPRPGRTAGEKMVEALRGRGTANRDLSTDEIMRLLRADD